jgi:TetR/AcrR family transcriptional regulator, cholesterol catabolism regulator
MAHTKPIPSFPSATTRSGGRRERHKADVRLRLFRAALQLFGTHGFADTTVEDITQAADVAKGTFFNYFPTKEHLLAEFGETRIDILRDAHRQAVERRQPVREVIRRLLHTMAQEPGASRAMARSMLLGGLRGEPCSTQLRKNLVIGRRILSDIIALGRRRGEIRDAISAEAAARLCQQLFFGGLHLWTLDPHLELSGYLDTTFAFFWAAVGAPQPSARKDSSRQQSSRKQFSRKRPS